MAEQRARGAQGASPAPPAQGAAVTACSYDLFHVPWLTIEHGSTPAAERETNPQSAFLRELPGRLRSFEEVVGYPPNQAFIGALDPRRMPQRPWHSQRAPGCSAAGPFGRILPERSVYALLKLADSFDLVALERSFRDEALTRLGSDEALREADLSVFKDAKEPAEIEALVAEGALPLVSAGVTVGCVKAAHPTDRNLDAPTMLENLAAKATAVYALRRLLVDAGIDPASIDYVLECSEEACGDRNQRGGGNFAKAVGELCGLANATGADIRSFCAGPVHALLAAAALVQGSRLRRVVVVAGGATAKLAMNARKHLEKGFPVLEDCLGAFALLVERGGRRPGLVIRTDTVGMHRIGSGSSPQAVIQDLVAAPLAAAGLRFGDVDVYAPELQNPEITEAAGAGNVTLANLKMIAATAVLKKEIAREEMDAFIAAHGTSGWAPTQGHIPSGVPAIGWFLRWQAEGSFRRGLLIGKGSLFLGRMTNLFDGVSLLLESPATPAATPAAPPATRAEQPPRPAVVVAPLPAVIRIGLTLPGSESGEEELRAGARRAGAMDPSIEPVFFEGGAARDPAEAHREMERALAEGTVHAAITFHYPLPVGIATVGHTTAPGTGRDLFIATTTGTASADRVSALVLNAIAGRAAAMACGIERPRVGLLALDGAAAALKILRELASAGYGIELAASRRGGDALLRGNDILAGTVDVVVCDTLTGNAVVKLLAAAGTAGRVESSGSGYGPGVGDGAPPVSIISRATSAAVVVRAILLAARTLRGGLQRVYGEERAAAERAGLAALLAGGAVPVSTGPASARSTVPRTVVDAEIAGVDVMELEQAVRALDAAGVYCEPGMGCTGPVLMVAAADRARAHEALAAAGLL